ncbi:hypothetical protein OC846_000740 [Tilletia horrida]|uniref:NmrA-like domain-containing protein n=1 Tax=Tilletia horrida TaxID=155126 RepID=A0AAN6GVF8_9BASI|nr:hypothetical protein OC846_000740 [Tilletia horrida]
MTGRVVITAATGGLASQIIPHLLRSLPASSIIATSRALPKLDSLAGRGIIVRQADFAQPDSLITAFKGAHTVLVVSVDSLGAEAVQQHKNAIDAAIAAGAKRIFYTSHQAANPKSVFAAAPKHAATEAYLEQVTSATGTKTGFTSLRNGFYMTTVDRMLNGAKHSGKLEVPANGSASWTHQSDLAEAIAKLLLRSLREEDDSIPRYATLANPEPVDLAQAAAAYSEVNGIEPIECVETPWEEYKQRLMAHGLPEERVNLLWGMLEASVRGEFVSKDPLLEQLLGRKAMSVRDMFAQQQQKQK